MKAQYEINHISGKRLPEPITIPVKILETKLSKLSKPYEYLVTPIGGTGKMWVRKLTK